LVNIAEQDLKLTDVTYILFSQNGDKPESGVWALMA
jgi:hypothetical protein